MNRIHCDWCAAALADKTYISINVAQFNLPVGGTIPIVGLRDPVAFCDRQCLIGFVQRGGGRFELPVEEIPEVASDPDSAPESGEEVADDDARGSDRALEGAPA